MSLNIIENQVVSFKNIAEVNDCQCIGQNFIRKVEKNDDFEVEFISTIVNSNPDFNQGLDNYIIGYTDSYINPHPLVSYFGGTDTVSVCDGSIVVSWPLGLYLSTNQYEFSINNGLSWFNETTLPSLTFGSLCADSYNCIIRDTLNGTEYYETIIIN